MEVSDLLYHLGALSSAYNRLWTLSVVSNDSVLSVEHGQVRVLWALGSHGLSCNVTKCLNTFKLFCVTRSKVAVDCLSVPHIHNLGGCQFHNGRVADLGTFWNVIVKMSRKIVWFEVIFLITICSFGVLTTISWQGAWVYRWPDIWAVWLSCWASLVILVKHRVSRDTLLNFVLLAWDDAASWSLQCSFPLYLLASFYGQASTRFHSLYFWVTFFVLGDKISFYVIMDKVCS